MSNNATETFKRSDPVRDDPVHKDPLSKNEMEGSRLLEALLDVTLAKYPQHYAAAMQFLGTITAGARSWCCEGAMETRLTVEGMEVTFDFQRGRGEWRRFLIMVSMCEGKVVYRNFRELAWGERSGIKGI